MVHALTSPAHGDELERARIHCQGMRELIESNPAHWEDAQALAVMRGLCKRAWAAMHDPVCRAYLAAIDDFAAALPLDSERGWSPGRMFGPWFVRREVLRKLRMLSDRLSDIGDDRNRWQRLPGLPKAVQNEAQFSHRCPSRRWDAGRRPAALPGQLPHALRERAP